MEAPDRSWGFFIAAVFNFFQHWVQRNGVTEEAVLLYSFSM